MIRFHFFPATTRNAIAINRVKICTSFSAGELCTAYYPKDQLWHRAVIESAYSTDKGPMVITNMISDPY